MGCLLRRMLERGLARKSQPGAQGLAIRCGPSPAVSRPLLHSRSSITALRQLRRGIHHGRHRVGDLHPTVGSHELNDSAALLNNSLYHRGLTLEQLSKDLEHGTESCGSDGAESLP